MRAEGLATATAVGGRAGEAATMPTTRLAEYWEHGMDIRAPFGRLPRHQRLRHIAWLAPPDVPYAMCAGEAAAPATAR